MKSTRNQTTQLAVAGGVCMILIVVMIAFIVVKSMFSTVQRVERATAAAEEFYDANAETIESMKSTTTDGVASLADVGEDIAGRAVDDATHMTAEQRQAAVDSLKSRGRALLDKHLPESDE